MQGGLEDYSCTVTHLEYHRAIVQNKSILVYVDGHVKSYFFNEVRPLLDKVFKNTSPEPREINSAVNDLVLKHDIDATIADPNVFVLIYDVYQHGFLYEIQSERALKIQIKQQLSEMLNNGLKLISVKEDVDQSIIESEIYKKYKNLTINLLENVSLTINNWEPILRAIMNEMKQFGVYKDRGKYMEEKIGECAQCNGCTVYLRKNQEMKLILPAVGDASEEHQSLNLNETHYYVVLSFNENSSNANIFINHVKRKLYITIKVNDYVICMHYPIIKMWPEKYNGEAKRDIINQRVFISLVEVVKLIVGRVSPWD